ncbi:hypothetical protein GCM10028798_14540 [Humibacter antri]
MIVITFDAVWDWVWPRVAVTSHDAVDEAGSPTSFAAASSTVGEVMLSGSKSTDAVPICPLEEAPAASELIRTLMVDV